MDRAEILDAVKKTICDDRQDVHGDPEETHARIAEYWNVFLSSWEWSTIDLAAADVAKMMILFKLARDDMNPAHKDNLHDLIGYAAIAAELGEE